MLRLEGLAVHQGEFTLRVAAEVPRGARAA